MYPDNNANYAQKASYPNNGLAAAQQAYSGAETCAPPKQSVTAEIINRLSIIENLLRDVLLSQTNLIDRLHGPRPSPCQGKNDCVQPSGTLNIIDSGLNIIVEMSRIIIDNQNTLERLG